MLRVPVNSPDGVSEPAQGTNPHKTRWEVCTTQASTPHQKHACAQGAMMNTCGWGVDITASVCWLSAAALMKQ